MQRYLQQHLFALLEFAAFEERPGEVQQHFCVLIFVEFLQAVLILQSRTKMLKHTDKGEATDHNIHRPDDGAPLPSAQH